ncbi:MULTISPECIES: sigma-70 family RNA polymerase sigma factor [Hydrogenophaga]|jgi:RNA polymerase sigma factor (sigma-70 family)|uniref:RNA polymerase sigma factor FecI n=1 Tax=Hydrogenophaga intermedia TaxID=65786 RepID=A0A1L1PKV3_HYDIT|nr:MULTISPECIES: sigma-70 family RNA polymerase sigma factor [Hydrogenophaga]AOS78668.1 RNA polymerase subunit sigma [Hydrogenophaga sp. PBC]TMU75023.1 sigma-70 family RNA polymerase sigma factor [Hydrogenophaga intermedia]CDN90010.1 RNA polymerase sigma factor FecI [Hydrogenophaga intermedia]
MPAGDTTLKIHALYSDHHGWLHGWLRRRLGCGHDAADLAHDTFVRLLVSGRTPEPEQSRAHLTQIAKGLVVDLHRRRCLEVAYLESLSCLPEPLAPSAEQRAIVIEELLRIDAALTGLPAKVREVFLQSQVDGLTYSQIANAMGISFATVRKYMLRAAQALHLALDT